jgi:uncharacterized Tic20 family protein
MKEVANLRVQLGILVLAVALVVLLITPAVVRAQQNDAASAISVAQSQLVSCFDAAKSAEAAGANISQLTAALNNAGLLLTNAQLAYSAGDYGAAQNFASQSQSVLSNFVSNANSLQTAATQNGNTSFLLNFVGSIAGTFVVLVGGVVVWVLLKRKYRNSEVAKLESDAV